MRPAYPSSKKVKDYDKLEGEKDDKLEGDAALKKFFHYNAFGILIDYFAILHNQQVESIGTVLSIDWKDVGAKKSRALFMMIWRSRHGKYDLI
ncbi:unnamed protein product [Brassica rapa subsp. trilocularis]